MDCHEGRLLNPGHAIEAMWFIMDLGKRLGRKDLIDKAAAGELPYIKGFMPVIRLGIQIRLF